MNRSGLDGFGAYQKAMALFDLVVPDMRQLGKDPLCFRLVSQQVDSADSICANIEEGYGRLSTKEYIRFLDYARGSARETQGRYKRLKHWFPENVIAQRVALTGEIIAILTTTINTLNHNGGARSVREDSEAYGSVSIDNEEAQIPPLPLDTRH